MVRVGRGDCGLGGDPALAAPIPAAAVCPAIGPSGQTALFLSGDGGWNLGVVSMAKAMAARGVSVIGLDWPAYQRARWARALP
jgi:type IV secretory pathway VirJ component